MASENQDQVVIKLEQNLVAEYCDQVRGQLLGAMNEDKGLTVDMSAVEMIDSAGLGVLISTQNSLNKTNRKLNLRGVADNIRKMMKLMRLDRHFTIED